MRERELVGEGRVPCVQNSPSNQLREEICPVLRVEGGFLPGFVVEGGKSNLAKS
jgi:hypothetical protein